MPVIKLTYETATGPRVVDVDCYDIGVGEGPSGLVHLRYYGIGMKPGLPSVVDARGFSMTVAGEAEEFTDPYSQESLKKAWAGGDEGEFTSADTLIYRSDEPTYYHMYTGCDSGVTMHNERIVRRGSQ